MSKIKQIIEQVKNYFNSEGLYLKEILRYTLLFLAIGMITGVVTMENITNVTTISVAGTLGLIVASLFMLMQDFFEWKATRHSK